MRGKTILNLRVTLSEKFFTFVLVLIGLLITGSSTAFAQETHKNPDRGFQPGASYSLSGIETVNTTNGNLMLNLPLATLPKGRGEVGATISLMYNSKLYDTTVEELPDESNQMALQNMLKKSEDGGWKYVTNDYRLDVVSRYETYSPGICNIGEYAYKWKVFLHMPDGSKKEFRPNGFNDIYNDGFFNVTPGGYRTYPCPTDSTLQSSSGMVYYSIDGSYTKLVVDYVGSGFTNGENNPWTLYLPNGSKIRGGTGITPRITDRNGNYIEGFTDNFNRSISIQYNATQDEDHITMQGANNQQLVWKVKWKTFSFTRQYKTTGAGNEQLRGGTSTQTLSAEFRVVDKITLPTQLGNLFYEFHYNRESNIGWGEISSVTLPSGASAAYEYKWDTDTSPSILPTTKHVLGNSVKKKTLSYLSEYDGSSSSVSEIWQYNINNQSSTITAPDGNVTTQYHGDTSYENKMSGLVYKTTNSNGSITEKIWNWNYPTGANNTANINAYVKTEFVTIPDNSGNPSLTAIKDYTIDPNGNQTLVKEYDWAAYNTIRDGNGNLVIPGGAQLKRITASSYYNTVSESSNNAYWQGSSPNIKNAVKSTEVQDGNSNPKSRVEMFYDNPATTGNLTQTKAWDSTKGGYTNPLGSNSISTSMAYDPYGNPTLQTDTNNVQTQITYGSVNGYTNLYPTETKTAYGTAVQRTSQMEYDFNTGLVKKVIDVDNGVAAETEYDALGRPTKVKAASGTPLEVWTRTEYSDSARRVIVRSDLFALGDGKKVSIQHYDQLGRVRLSRTLEDAAQDATNETLGIKAQSRYRYTTGAVYSLTSNPYRANYSSNATGEPSMGWTRAKAESSGRHSEVETFSGATLPYPFLLSGYNTNSTGVVKTDIDSDRTLVTDQAGKQRISRTNGLGQMTDVWEITAADSSTVSVSFPSQTLSAGYQTSYEYNTLNNLTKVIQGSQQQNRTFSYSSLSRLLSAFNPESGTVSYQYDNNGNLTQKTDARPVTTTYTYDEMNRVKTRTYGAPSGLSNYQAAPAVTYTYDNINVTNSKGKLTKVTNGFSTTEYTEFDKLGRVKKSKQTTDNFTPPNDMLYTYNLAGQLVEQRYPSGRIVKNVLETDGDLAKVQSQKNSNYGFWTYADQFAYNSAGAVTSMQLGNGKWESTVFNSRLQPTQIALGTVNGGTDKLKLNFTYGATSSTNNGNVQTQTITVPTTGAYTGFTATQTYTYDSLNRLKIAEETGGAQGWKETYTYDRYGNKNYDTANTTTISGCATNVCNPTASTTNNRLSGYGYDSAGNITTDAQSRTFTYDGENKQTKVMSGTTVIGEYFYDGDGKRVKKKGYTNGALTEETIFVYDASGRMVAEYSNNPATASTARVSYLTNDHLGSPRITTDKDGRVFSRRDFLPFGEELTDQHTSQRNINYHYGDDGLRQKFTGYERDGETELDFAQARYFNSSVGRFSSPDPVMISPKRLLNPQMINLYVYAVNNPLFYIDPDGETPYQLGQATVDDLKRRIKETETLLKKEKKNEDLIEQLATLKNDLAVVTIGNKVVGGWLEALTKRGEANGLKIEDFKITTEPVKDLTEAVETAKKNGQPGGNISLALGKLMWADKSTTATVIGKDIYILTPSNAYQDSAALARGGQLALPGSADPISQSDVNLFGGSALLHERDHRDSGADEVTAYTTQINFLDRMNTNKQFKNQEYFKAIRQGLVDLRESYRPKP